jgi:hypothetical protein
MWENCKGRKDFKPPPSPENSHLNIWYDCNRSHSKTQKNPTGQSLKFLLWATVGEEEFTQPHVVCHESTGLRSVSRVTEPLSAKRSRNVDEVYKKGLGLSYVATVRNFWQVCKVYQIASAERCERLTESDLLTGVQGLPNRIRWDVCKVYQIGSADRCASLTESDPLTGVQDVSNRIRWQVCKTYQIGSADRRARLIKSDPLTGVLGLWYL